MDVVNITYTGACALPTVSPLCAKLEGYWQQEWEAKKDARVADWALMDSPLPTLLLTLAYLVFVRLVPVMMEKRKAFELRTSMAVYNLAMVIFNLYMMLEFYGSTRHLSNRFCLPIDYSNDPQAVRLAHVCWYYYISKLLEFTDTVMFILRKKNGQVTFLHVYHHSTMFMLWYIGVKWVAGGLSWFGACLNCGIHVIMYLYYFLAGLGPGFRKYLWWKKYMTTFQLTQFFICLVHGIYSFYNRCDFPFGIQIAYCIYISSHVALFGNFYKKAYLKKTPQSATAKQNGVKTE
ncbi:very long chain fatty acid elongase 4-like [Sycon ciliatum]|uniref:very long chain fatty acid elongase 4-like n=1 Tax=Sycon ciliatum TaxID=27933 RepID=UPI0020AC7D2F|eukprot:scpid87583/ scgid34771/ Elongation of very long chain fatty acids protein 4; 3-keto acyl-CoA synthase Elovl4; ELOVL fatty acid elongase 4